VISPILFNLYVYSEYMMTVENTLNVEKEEEEKEEIRDSLQRNNRKNTMQLLQ